MDDDQFGPAQPMMDPIQKAYDRVSDVFKRIPGKLGPSQTSDHDAAVADINKGLNDKSVEEANKTYVKTEPSTPVTRKALRKAPRKR